MYVRRGTSVTVICDNITMTVESRAVSMRAYLALSGKHANDVCRLIAYNGLGLLVKENRHLRTTMFAQKLPAQDKMHILLVHHAVSLCTSSACQSGLYAAQR